MGGKEAHRRTGIDRTEPGGARDKIRKELTHKDDLERQTRVVLTELASLREREIGQEGDLPFKTKRKIIGLLVDDIVINGKDRAFELRGVIRAMRSYGQDFELVSTPKYQHKELTIISDEIRFHLAGGCF
jgi:hypothetical protein